MTPLGEIFSEPVDLLRLEPEELAGVLMEAIPSVMQQGMFHIQSLVHQLYQNERGDFRLQGEEVELALAEAMSWLMTQGLVVKKPGQQADWLVLTRRGRALKSRTDVAALAKGRTLPIDLLQPALADKVHPLFVRGDHDTAVFQAFKEVEVAVRRACGYSNDAIGKTLMTRALNVDDGPLADAELVRSEREAEMALFVGAVGHAKNPSSHRDVGLSRQEAARLIIFASHLLSIVEERAARLQSGMFS